MHKEEALMKNLYAVSVIAAALVAAEAYYRHPTYGMGIRALVLAARAALVLG
jgi:hypothetical protein